MYYDSHTHLNADELYSDRKTYLQHFVAMGGKGLVNIGVDEKYNERAIEIAREAKEMGVACRVKATMGYHPSEVCFGNITEENIDEKIESLRSQFIAQRSQLVAVGECGIDVHYDGDPHIELQKRLFREQCLLAQELHLPIVIHSRSDFESTREVIQDFKDEKIYFHCFGYGADEVKKLQEYFPQIRFGFCGNITYPKAESLRDAFRACEIHNIVLETDAPRLSPQKVRGEKNEPANVRYIYEYITELMGTSLEVMCSTIENNIKSLYNI